MNQLRNTPILATVVGRVLARTSGPRMVSLPFGLTSEDAVAIVRAANALRPDVKPAYAILMTTDQPLAPDVVTVGAHQAAQYREGDRLLVVHGAHTGLASNTQTYIELLGPSWPEFTGDTATLEVVTREALDLVLGSNGASEEARSRLLSVLRLLAGAYKRMGSGLESWNALWWQHVSIGLGLLKDSIDQAPADAERTAYLHTIIPAAFGLPQLPKSTLEDALAAKLARAWSENWGDSETATASATSIGLRLAEASGKPQRIATIDFQGLDEFRVVTGNPISAWETWLTGHLARVEALTTLSIDDFLQPYGGDSQAIMVLSQSVPCAYEPLTADLAYVATETMGSYVHSEPLELRLPVVAQLVDAHAATHVAITTSLTAFSFEGDVVLEGGRPIARGKLVCKTNSFRARTLKIGVRVPSGDPLDGVVPSTALAKIAVMHPDLPTVSVRSLQKDKLGARTEIVVLDHANGDVTEILPGSGSHRVVVSEPSGLFNPIVQGQETELWPGRPNFRHAKTVPADVLVEVGETSLELILPDDPKHKRLAPLLAHIDGVPIQEGSPPESATAEIRGALEQHLSEMLVSDEEIWRKGLGHFVLPVRDGRHGGGFLQDPNGITMTTADWATESVWKALKLPSMPEGLVHGGPADEFRAAFLDLDLLTELRNGQETGRSWPSRLDFGGLWGSPKLERYLYAYTELMAAAQESGDELGIFWATYPFSASVWAVDEIAQLQALLLSPLHPVRLAWMAGVTQGVIEEPDLENRRRFSGVIEGWNLPYIGPSEVSEGKVIAVPIDNGPEQIFIGWSMMIRTSNQLAPLRTPERIAGRRAPGSSVSGLNGSSAAKAMSDYRRLNPFTSTLTVDLAAGSPGPRMEGVDRAVVDEIARWALQSDDSLAGGARVWDSLNRIGQPPRDYVSEQLGSGTPLTWSRYRPQPGKDRKANIRILQDAGHTLHITSDTAEPMGSMGQIPFRRHEILSQLAKNENSVDAVPAIRPGAGWQPLARALTSVENSEVEVEQRIIRSVLAGSSLVTNTADWTITGDAMINPSALASQVAVAGTNLALWEWRPPFLSSGRSSDDSLLERRPYLSVVRLPQSLTARVDKLLTQSWTQSWGVSAGDVLSELGSRGIGLSSLLAIGGAQARGALGFFTTLRMLDRAGNKGFEQLILPIDACDEYLTALSGEKHSLGERRRADLLLIRLSAGEVTLVPIEIKYYGMDNPSASLPQVGSARLDDPLDQLASTQRVLQGLYNAEQGALWNAAFAALVEVGLRLNPGSISRRGWSSDRLADLANGLIPVAVGRPLLAYFKHGSGAYRATIGVQSDHPEMPLHAQFVADPARVAKALYDPRGGADSLITDWRQLVDWACGASADGEGTATPLGAIGGPTAPGSAGPSDDAARHRISAEDAGRRLGQGAGTGPSTEAYLDAGTAPAAVLHAVDHPSRQVEMRAGAIQGQGVRFEVGHLVDSMGEAEADFWPANTALTQLNIGVVGNLGTGKTELIKALVAKLRREAARAQPNPVSILILDYKGDFAGEEFLNAVGGRLLRPHRLPLNYFELLEPYSPMAAVRKAGSFNDVLNQIFNVGPKQQNTLRRVILELFKSGQAPTISEVLDEYRQVADYDSVVGVLEGWVLGEVFGNRDDELHSFAELMKDSVTVLSLLDFGADQNSKNALVAMFLNLYYEYMAKLPKWPYEGTSPQLRRLNSFLLVDEATNIMSYNFDSLNSLLLQGREFGVGVILSSQYLSHFKSSKVDYAQALRTWFIHSVPNVTPSQLQSLGLPNANEVTANRIVGLPTHHALYSSVNYPGRFIQGEPFYKWIERHPNDQ